MKQRPNLMVPIRDRRQRKRILTLKNFGKFALMMAIVLLGITIVLHLDQKANGDYGRLFGKQVPRQTEIARRPVDVIREAPPVVDQTAADPMLVAPAAREQYLGVDSANRPVVTSGVMTAQPLDAPRGTGTSIVGGPEGVAVVKGGTPQRPALSGGIFRQ
jgi:hypothetical protein